MRLEFGILWIENQPNDIQTQIEEVEEHIQEVGFSAKIELQPNGDKISELSKRQERFHDFDLVVVDYDLGKAGHEGDAVAEEIRRRFGFTDIVFYSGLGAGELRKKVFARQIDGVYCIDRQHLAEKLLVHIDQAVRRLSRLEAMRGLSMATVGKCDDEFRRLLLVAYDKADEEVRKQLVAELDDLVERNSSLQQDRYRKHETFKERLESRAVTSFHLQKLALAATKGKTEFAAHRAMLGKYDADVLALRNVLGHAVEVREKDGWVVSSRDAAITVAEFPRIRQALNRHHSNICSLAAAFGCE